MAGTKVAQGFRVTAASDTTEEVRLSSLIGAAGRAGAVVLAGSITAGAVTVMARTNASKVAGRAASPVEGGVLTALICRGISLPGDLWVSVEADGSFNGDAFIEFA